jgi:hypothetical protein
VVGAKNERHGVEQEDGRFGLIRHATESISVGAGASRIQTGKGLDAASPEP